ncbi:SH2 domain-containing protein 1B-like [Megalops cyprinoides]|uniref:SH2 domain-containing protein 1B-like n=1 Tax=Megalops cyprinoides TaxID=118141 RepID=UPI001864C7C5|nr:SH2 domain-containing protein 1B-like [Megalops cyprinoides]
MDLKVYHGSINKQTCEELLSMKGKDGSFLIRDSETIQGALCLCVYKQRVVYTYRILQNHAGYYTLQASAGVQEKFFKTLEELIKNYKKSEQGLAVRLRHGVKRKSQLQDKHVQDETLDYEEVECSSDYVDVLPS